MNQSPSDFGYAGLFLWVFAEQGGLPLPALPVLVAAGTLISAGRLDLGPCLLLVVAACLTADTLWYLVGRAKGPGILHLICHLSWKPNRCIASTKGMFMRYGAQTLLFAKFVPGLNTLAPPLAGAVGISLRRFVAYDVAGSTIWSLIPFLLGMELRRFIPAPEPIWAFLRVHLWGVVGGVILVILAWRLVARRRYLNALNGELKKAMTVAELKEKIDRGDDFVLLDIRHPMNVNFRPVQIPGALHIGYHELDKRLSEIPLHRPLVIYCDCPKDQAAAQVVRRLRKVGAISAHMLRGGLDEWEKHGLAIAPTPTNASLLAAVALAA